MEWSEGGKWDNCNSIINKYIENIYMCKKIKNKVSKFYQLLVKNMTEYYFAPMSSHLYYINRTPRITIIHFSTYPEI